MRLFVVVVQTMSLCFSRLCLLAICLSGLMSVALGKPSVQWSVYSDINCSTIMTIGSDSNPATFTADGVSYQGSLQCIQITGVNGVLSANAICASGTVNGVSGVTASGLTLYSDRTCKNSSNGPSMLALGYGSCGSSSIGSLSARVNCNSAASLVAASLTLVLAFALLVVVTAL